MRSWRLTFAWQELVLVCPAFAFILTLLLLPRRWFLGDAILIFGVAFIYIVPLLVLLSLLVSCVELLTTRRFHYGRTSWALILTVVLSILSASGALYCRDRYRIFCAKSFLDAQVAGLDAYMAKAGRYPTRVEEFLPVEQALPYLIANHYGFTSCSTPPAELGKQRWYCAVEQGKGFELSFGYFQGMDQRPSYTLDSKERVWKCAGRGCLTDHD